MKANEVPERIYLSKNNKTLLDMLSVKDTERIEYIRTDAFIEKACDYLMEYEFNDSPTITDRRKRVDKFINYMKGE